jgi:hypothetical protein
MNGYVELGNFDITDFFKLDYKKATIDESFLEKYISSGHNQSQIVIYNYFEPNPMPDPVDKIKKYFSFLNPISVAVNRCLAGQYLPLHRDLYYKWQEVFCVKDIEKIKRYIVMLEDHIEGQMLEIDSEVYKRWSKGDYFGWTGSTLHAIYNFSYRDRYAIQITGL